MFQTLIVQPIYNILVAVYGLLPGHDLGISLIIFTVLIRLLLWPLLKKQLHQSKVMRDLQPELKKIKKAAAGDKQAEGRMMMELYKEKGISPFGTIGLTLIQLPIFIGVFQAARLLTENIEKLETLTYSFVRDIPHITHVIADHSLFNYTSFGFIDLSKRAIAEGVFYWPLIVLALVSTALSFYQVRQILPEQKEKKRLRDVLKTAGETGKQPEQEDISAAMSSGMTYIMPILTLLFGLFTEGAMVMYLFASSAIAIVQQTLIFRKDTDEMENTAEVVAVKKQPESAAPTAEKVTKGRVVTKTRIISPTTGASSQSNTTKKSKKASKKSKGKRR
jgi:YidC/Oxa1 family membrane protein insertase